ncbi:MAG: exodeoxyribonuclease V subunit gamma [Rudaea sp.]
MSSDEPRLIVHRASRTERLADELIAHLRDERPANPLTAQTIVIPHLGMRRWLLQTIAKSSSRGIAANFDTQLPWQWLQRTAEQVLGDAALVSGEYNTATLQWHIYNALPMLNAIVLARYVDGDDGERRRFQLASHLADVFTQYLVYRADMILAWERGAEPGDWQANLWRLVRARIDKPHRAQRKDALVAALYANGDGEKLPLHVFGVSHLPPDVLACLRATAMHRIVHVYFPDPCREHWDYLRKKRALLASADAESLYFEVGHPLLASLGRVGQDFSLALDDADDHRDPLDERDVPDDARDLLDAVQGSIRYLRPEFVCETLNDRTHEHALRDTSLRVHACHTRERELEVLKDQLLGFLADDATLQPRDIVVMAPDIAAYAPYLPSVFGEAARYSDEPTHIPWHVADVALARTHPLFTGFSKLLDLGESRLRVSDVIDLLDVPAIARRFGLGDEAQSRLEPWLRRARVAWGLDAAMKARVGAAPLDANTWSFGFDRLYAGLIVGDEGCDSLVDGILPVSGVSGKDVDAIGRLDRLIDTLGEIRNELTHPRPLTAWSIWLIDTLDAMFAIDFRDDREDDAMNSLRRSIAALADQEDAIGGENLPWSVARDVIRGTLDDVSDRQPFLLGGVTFCGLVPQRSIPFRVVFMLGMNEGEYPRIATDGGLNRMHARPRRGDRDTRNEDRYLFLEAMMAARDHLHISFVGEDVGDASRRNPAAPLAELLEFLDEQFGVADDETEKHQPWFIRHPLQPFDSRYYKQNTATSSNDTRLFSFNRAYEAPAEIRIAKRPFIDADADDPRSTPASNDISLKSLTVFWRDPAKACLRDGFGVSLDALGDDALIDSEPLTPMLDRRERFELQLLDDAWRNADMQLPVAPPTWLTGSGALPGGEVGARAYQRMRERVQPMLQAMAERLGSDAMKITQPVDFAIEGMRVVGVVDRIFRRADGSLLLLHTKPSGKADFRELIPFYIEWAALKLRVDSNLDAAFFECAEKTAKGVKSPDLCAAIVSQTDVQLRAGLGELIRMTQHATHAPPLFFPKTAWAWANAASEKRNTEARKTWQGGGMFNKGECNYEPSYAALIARDSEFLKHDSLAHHEFVATNRWLSDILDPDQTILLRNGTEHDA